MLKKKLEILRKHLKNIDEDIWEEKERVEKKQTKQKMKNPLFTILFAFDGVRVGLKKIKK